MAYPRLMIAGELRMSPHRSPTQKRVTRRAAPKRAVQRRDVRIRGVVDREGDLRRGARQAGQVPGSQLRGPSFTAHSSRWFGTAPSARPKWRAQNRGGRDDAAQGPAQGAGLQLPMNLRGGRRCGHRENSRVPATWASRNPPGAYRLPPGQGIGEQLLAFREASRAPGRMPGQRCRPRRCESAIRARRRARPDCPHATPGSAPATGMMI